MDPTQITTTPEAQDAAELWGDTTDPGSHDPEHYRYLVHALNTHPDALLGVGLLRDAQLRQEERETGRRIVDPEDGDQSINLLYAPDRLDERVSLSCSLVDESHRATWGKVGLIIQAPRENVIITSPADAGTTQMSKRLLLEQAANHTLLPPDTILEQTNPTIYNEIVVLARQSGQEAALAGFFYKTAADGTPLNRFLYQEVKNRAEILGLPLVPIIEPNRYPRDEIVRWGESLEVHLSGKSFFLEGEPELKYTVSGGIHDTFASPEEMAQVFNYLREQGVPEAEIAARQADYDATNEIRHRPQVHFDEGGNISWIRQRCGYGAEAVNITINAYGYERTNVFEVEERNEAYATNMDRRTRDVITASEHEAEQVIAEALEHLSDADQREQLRQWWSGVQTSVNERRAQAQAYHEMFAQIGAALLEHYPR